MSFSSEIKQQAMVACGRRCCVCHKFCGNNMEVHHIKARADGGSDTFENAIPLCFDCHAEVRQYDSKHPKGIRFTEQELIQHRNRWYSQIEAGINKKNVCPSDSITDNSIKITRQEGYRDIMLSRVTTGRELINYIQGVSAMEYNHDDLFTREEAVAVSNFVQQVSEIIDWDYLVEPSDYIMQGFELNTVIKSLENAGFWVFCAREKRRISGGETEPADFPTLLLQIRRKDSPEIFAIKENS